MKIFALTAICALVAVCSAQTTQAFINEALQSHNSYRAKHGAAPLKISSTLNAAAQKWANHLASVDTGLKHSTGTGYGENIAWAKGRDLTGASSTTMWYNEVSNYDFNSGASKNGGVIGHFTQVVWKGSKELGIARAVAANGGIYVVANYNPPGNYRGQYVQNVGKA